MPLIEADATALEVVGAAYLSQCPVLCKEVRDGIDIHGENQNALGLPTRLTAKKFKFRLIYGGNEYSYANDPDFNHISGRPKYWKKVIENYYNKYYGLAKWHIDLVSQVNSHGIYTSPTGRTFKFEMVKNRGVLEYPRTQILNYPVQSLGADIMTIIRVSAFKRINRLFKDVLFVNTVHDSVLLDCPRGLEYEVIPVFHEVFSDFQRNFKAVFKSDFNLPLTCKVKMGDNWKDMKEI